MDLVEIDQDELVRLIEVVEGIVNFGVGQTELILSTIYWIFTNMMKDNLSSCSWAIKKESNIRRVIKRAIKILVETLGREDTGEVHEDEEEEKHLLALSVMNFLKYVSEEDETSHYLIDYAKKHP